MVDWKPISEKALLARIEQGEARMSAAERRLWEANAADAQKLMALVHHDATVSSMG